MKPLLVDLGKCRIRNIASRLEILKGSGGLPR